MKKRFTSRGYSVLAALVFVAILGSVAVVMNVSGPSGNPLAMTAAPHPASNPTPGRISDPPASASGSTDISSAPESCTDAISKAKGKNEDPQATSVSDGQTGTLDTCFGAVLKSPELDKNKESSYQCVGRSGNATYQDGKLRTDTKPNKNVPVGKCQVKVCDAASKKCIDAKLYDGTGTVPSQQSVATGGQPGFPDPNLGVEPQTLGGAPGQQEIDKAFKQQEVQNELNNIGNDNERIKEELRRLSEDEACAQSPAECSKTREELNKTLAANEARQKELEEQLKKLETNQSGSCPLGQTWISNTCYNYNGPAKSGTCPNGQAAISGNCYTKISPEYPPGKLPQQKCPSGTIGNYPACTSQPTCTFGSCGGNPGPQEPQNPGGGSPLSALGSLLQGLMRGLGGGGAPQGPQCSSDPAAYQQQQQQYQMQLQQYNYQLQQHNLQQQQAYLYGGYPPVPPTPPAPCTPNSNQNTCPTQPPQPTSGCENGSWRPVNTTMSNGRQCVTGWQCSPVNATPPSAELSCQPKVADVGMTVSISFSCTNATGSSGAGFATGNATSGATTTVIENPPAGASGRTLTLTCRNQNLTDRAECSIQIARPTIVLVANPRNVASGESSRVGWITSGMQSCTIASPQMPGFTQQHVNNKSVNGTATTSPITRDTTVVLTCETLGGNTKAATTTIQVGNSTSSAMIVSSNIDGDDDVQHGDTAAINWNAPNPPGNSAVALWLIDTQSGLATGLIQGQLAASGTYNWTLPATSSACAVDSPIVCGADLVAGRSYSIRASLYSPPNAHLGGFPPANPITPTYHDEVSTAPFEIEN